MPQNTNLNIPPYFDDFNEDNNYKKVLFKPGTTVQARELTTLQTSLQDQIEKFGKSFFKDGSKVTPGNWKYFPKYDAVLIDPIFLGLDVSLYLKDLIGRQIRGSISGTKAKVENFLTRSESDIETNTLYISYISTSTDNSSTFLPDEDLIIDDGENLVTSSGVFNSNTAFANTISTDPIRTGTAASIEDGVYFIRGFFVTVPSSTIILDQYNTSSSYKVGLSIDENIVTAYDDPSLFDNASGFSNFAAPGADRLQITSKLDKRSVDVIETENFVELFRVLNGSIVENTLPPEVEKSNHLSEQIASAVYDLSGDFIVSPFNINVRDSLNDYVDADGLFTETQKTPSGNTPNDSLLTYQISPGKAYVKGYELNKVGETFIDAEKPRTVKTVEPEFLSFEMGNILKVNKVYGSPIIGLGVTSYISFRNSRVNVSGVSTGTEIGRARVYDFNLDPNTNSYVGDSTTFDLHVVDFQTYTTLTVSTKFDTILASTLVEGKNSGARGYVAETTYDSTSIKLSGVTGKFIEQESLIVNKLEDGRIIKSVIDYTVKDILSVETKNGIGTTIFTADTLLSSFSQIDDISSTYSIGTAVSGITTISASRARFTSDAIKKNNIIAYNHQGSLYYNRVDFVPTSGNYINVTPVSNTTGIATGSVAQGATVSNIVVVSPQILEINKADLLSPLPQTSIASVNFDKDAELIVKQQFPVTITSQTGTVTITGDKEFVDFSPISYTLTDDSSGVVENLTTTKFSLNTSAKTITLSGITAVSGNATLTATLKLKDVNPKTKVLNKCAKLTVSRTVRGTAYNGLESSKIYGLRVEDDIISLNRPDVLRIRAIYQSSDNNDPILPTISITNPSSSISTLTAGETIIGNTSKAIGTLISTPDSTTLNFVSVNNLDFIGGEIITFKESGLTATIAKYNVGDANIIDQYDFDSGQRDDYLDYSRLILKNKSKYPNRRISVIYDYYSINTTIPGDFVCVNSYGDENYSENLPLFKGRRLSDFLDFRPRIKDYVIGSSYSPFAYESRDYNLTENSNPYVLATKKQLKLSYSYFLGRVDKVVLDKNGVFSIIQGSPSETLIIPPTPEGKMHIATAFLPPYLFNRSEATITYPSYRRYKMEDISRLEDRITALEKFTQLSLLELQTSTTVVRDNETGLEEFKTGFFVDNFRSHQSHDIKLSKASIDLESGILRPSHFTTGIDLAFQDEYYERQKALDIPSNEIEKDLVSLNGTISDGIKKTGDIISLDYGSEPYIANVFATNAIRSLNPTKTRVYIGSLEISPSTDIWIDERKLEVVDENIKNDYYEMIDIYNSDPRPGFIPIDWNSWSMYYIGSNNSKFEKIRSNAGDLSKLPGSKVDVGTDSISDQYIYDPSETRDGIQYGLANSNYNQNLSGSVLNQSIKTYLRSRNIQFKANNLKPKTQHYAFFGGENVTQYCFPKILEVQILKNDETGKTKPFQIGETVYGTTSDISSFKKNRSEYLIKFRVAHPRHKEGDYNNPKLTYTFDPYVFEVKNAKGVITSDSVFFPNTEETKTGPIFYNKYTNLLQYLNIDLASLSFSGESNYGGFVEKEMYLYGEDSEAVARVRELRLISDHNGDLLGSFYIPKEKFSSGSKVFKLTSSDTNSDLSSNVSNSTSTFNQTLVNEINKMSFAEVEFESLSKVDVSKTNIINIRKPIFNKTNAFETSVLPTVFTDKGQPQVLATTKPNPLYQTFRVLEEEGIFLSKVEIFFYSIPKLELRKDRDQDGHLPVTLQIRTTNNGIPTQTVIPFSEVSLKPSQIIPETNPKTASTEIKKLVTAGKGTIFEFKSPVYLEGNGKEYAIALTAPDDSYIVWTSKIGSKTVAAKYATLDTIFRITQDERDLALSKYNESWKKDREQGLKKRTKSYETALYEAISEYRNISLTELQKIKFQSAGIPVASKQPNVINLFPSLSGGGIPIPEPVEDLTFTLWKCSFVENYVGSVRFYNVDLPSNNKDSNRLRINPFTFLSRQTVLTWNNSLNNVGILTNNLAIIQKNTNATAKVVIASGSVGIGTTSLSYLNTGIGLTPSSGVQTYYNTPLQQVTSTIVRSNYDSPNLGIGLKGDITVLDGTVSGVNVTVGGTNFSVGDVVSANIGVANNVTFAVGIISSFNSIVIDDVQGDWNNSDGVYVDNGSFNIGIGTNYAIITNPSNPTETVRDGTYVLVNHRNHGMHSKTNRVEIRGVSPDTEVSQTTRSIGATATSSFDVTNIYSFQNFENVGVGSTNPGYAIIADKEIISYTGIAVTNAGTSSGQLTGVTRKVKDGYDKVTRASEYPVGTTIRKYELSGVSLRRINTEHSFTSVDNSLNIGLDSYYIKINSGISFTNSLGKTIALGVDRTVSSPLPTLYLNDSKNTGGENVFASGNISYETLTPVCDYFVPANTDLTARVRTISGSSLNSSEESFIDLGYETVNLNTTNYLKTPRLIASTPNKNAFLNSSDLLSTKSLVFEFQFNTTNANYSPLLDINRVFAITTSNRINSPYNDSNDLYIERVGVKRPDFDDHDATYVTKTIVLENPSTGIQVSLKAIKPSGSNIRCLYRVFRSDSQSKDQDFVLFNTNGLSDNNPTISEKYTEHKWTSKGLPEFASFQIKIIMTSTNQANPPKIKDLRVISLA